MPTRISFPSPLSDARGSSSKELITPPRSCHALHPEGEDQTIVRQGSLNPVSYILALHNDVLRYISLTMAAVHCRPVRQGLWSQSRHIRSLQNNNPLPIFSQNSLSLPTTFIRPISSRPARASPTPSRQNPAFPVRRHFSSAASASASSDHTPASRNESTSSKMAPRILIFGTGSIGAVYTYIFSRAVTEANVFAVCRSNYDAASTQGFTINSSLFGQNLNVRPQVVKTVDEAVTKSDGKPFDYIIVTAKAIPSTPSLPEQIAPAVSPSTTIALIQNGIGVEDIYSQAFPQNPLLSCVVYLPATQTSPGTIKHGEVELLHIGTYPAGRDKSSAEDFASVLRSGNGTAKVHDDVQIERWTKLLVNASWNPICALSRCRDVQFMHSSDSATDVVKQVMLEITAVAQASGYPQINEAKIDHQLGRAKARSLPGVEPSMLADAFSGRNMEVDAIVGNTVRIAEEKGVKTPLLTAIYALTKGLDASFTRARESK
ncbi:ketopantoate reductase PanE/ApbA C terminal-domain-containing protein [Exophiala viscosa]|uniref:ketopantoate reductase PanE/ApbA C terminal-domain-containing protein n=1 Tax=Exophiala viscosa TaxID=2486360 RepID=UPI0021920B90|nr:ketopantoate reductase PanE/ApbA C terminal-domain-containing protein [Exophiala viscosa]